MLSAAAGRRGAALGAAAAAAACLATAVAAPARADSVRSSEQWVLDAVNAPAAWLVSRGAGVTVAVIDSGVNRDVPDLAGAVRPGPDLTGVGTPPGNPNWGIHGTWMASLIAGHGHGSDGSDGIIGIAPRSRVLSIRVITDKSDPGYGAYQHQPLSRGQQELADGITAAVRDGASVISMSLGYGAPSKPVRAALQSAFAHNVVVVASSGNSGGSATGAGKGSAPYSFPADYPGVLGVGAVSASGAPAAFSSENLSVQIAAPGVSVPAEGRNSRYWLVSGTSPACAIAAGVAALIKSKYPRLPDNQVLAAMTRSAWHRPRGGYDQQVGFGTVNAAAALAAAGRLARAGPGTPSQDVTSSSHFGGGPAAAPAPPVQPRGPLALIGYLVLGLASLGLVGAITIRMVGGRPGAGPSGSPAFAGPPAGSSTRRHRAVPRAGPGNPPGPPGSRSHENGYPRDQGYLSEQGNASDGRHPSDPRHPSDGRGQSGGQYPSDPRHPSDGSYASGGRYLRDSGYASNGRYPSDGRYVRDNDPARDDSGRRGDSNERDRSSRRHVGRRRADGARAPGLPPGWPAPAPRPAPVVGPAPAARPAPAPRSAPAAPPGPAARPESGARPAPADPPVPARPGDRWRREGPRGKQPRSGWQVPSTGKHAAPPERTNQPGRPAWQDGEA